jgi:general nucleoside transport system ATP-binding protein
MDGEIPPQSLLRLRGVTKAFPGVLANDGVDIELLAGEVHALLGENGAGKSTLMGVATGTTTPDQGQILLRGHRVELGSPRQALLAGIGYVQQHVALIPTMTVAENMAVSLRATGERISTASAARRVNSLCAEYGMTLAVNSRVGDLSVADQQRAELVKALLRKPMVLVLDEPTTLLTPQEAKELGRLMRNLTTEGIGIFFISHKLEEVLEVSDRISVLRRGKMVGTVPAAGASREQLANMMIGELQVPPVSSHEHRPDSGAGRTLVLDARSICIDTDSVTTVTEATLDVAAGEILGIAGLEGSGQVELTEALAGVRPIASGEIHLSAERQDGRPIREWRRRGVAHIPADRLATGLVTDMTVLENLLLPRVGDSTFSRYGLIRRRATRRAGLALMKRFDIRGGGPDARAGQLSGGNQQKVVLARELAESPSVIVCCYATRGLDFRSSEWLHQEIRQRRDGGCAVVYASVDLEELLSLCDRVAVMHAGQIVGVVPADSATAESIGLMMGGVRQSDGQR